MPCLPTYQSYASFAYSKFTNKDTFTVKSEFTSLGDIGLNLESFIAAIIAYWGNKIEWSYGENVPIHPLRCPFIFHVTNNGVLASGKDDGHFGAYFLFKTAKSESKQILQCSLVA